MVGASGFEPPTPRSRTECSTRLSHAPTIYLSYRTNRPGQFLHGRHRVEIRQIRLKRRDRRKALGDGVTIGPWIRLPIVLRFFDPVIRPVSGVEPLIDLG